MTAHSTSAASRTSFARDAALVLVLALAPAVGLGIARFAYALILPDMRISLGWSFAEAGLLNTVNAAGYLAAALGAARLVRKLGAFPAVFWGSLTCVAGLFLSAASGGMPVQSIARFLAGGGGALAVVAGGALSAGIADRRPERASFLLSLFYTGPGLGIIVSGLITPLLIEAHGPGSWRLAWAVLGVLSVVLTLSLLFARAEGGRSVESVAAPAALRLGAMRALLLGYGAFGAGYIAYMTFMIAWVREAGGSAVLQALFWSLIGAGTIASPWLWSGLMGRLSGGRAVAALTAVTLLGAVLPLASAKPAALFLSALVFGSAFFAVVAATTAFVRRNLPRSAWPGGIAAMTIAFGLGQTLGPVATGALTDLSGGLALSLWASAAMLALGAGMAWLQPDLPPA
jgi:predicted MFS family arabinose efflux permease